MHLCQRYAYCRHYFLPSLPLWKHRPLEEGGLSVQMWLSLPSQSIGLASEDPVDLVIHAGCPQSTQLVPSVWLAGQGSMLAVLPHSAGEPFSLQPPAPSGNGSG